jgi:ribosomal protein L7Ae-like RNA K-turn-binding protein
VKYVLLERLQKEIVSKLGKSRGMKRKRDDTDKSQTITETAVRSRFLCGINQCTRALEDDTILQSPLLIILARDVRPATIFEHISLYAHIRNIPILILPGRASLELGEAVGIRRVAALSFLPRDDEQSLPFKDNKTKMEEWKECNIDVDAFVSYVASKIPR